MDCGYKDRVLDYLKGKDESPEIEKHIEECAECRAMVEGYLEREKELEIPPTAYEGEDKKLKEQVIHYERGTKRIVIFTIVGLIMGWFSISYYTDTFIVTKIILAIPYKVSEIIYRTLHEVPYPYSHAVFDAFFPQNRMVTFLAERLTPILTGGAIYGSLAYFTGDARIFTLRRYLKFAAVWAAVILGYVGLMLGLNAYGIKLNDRLQDINGFSLNTEFRGNGYFKGDPEDFGSMVFDQLNAAFNADGNPEEITGIKRDTDGEVEVDLYMGRFRDGYMITAVNPQDRYLITDQGTAYRISGEFARLMKQYQTDCFEGVEEEYERTGEVNLDEAVED